METRPWPPTVRCAGIEPSRIQLLTVRVDTPHADGDLDAREVASRFLLHFRSFPNFPFFRFEP